VAIKVIKKGAGYVAGPHPEAVLMAAVAHPRVVQLIEVFDTSDEICLIMEAACGGDLFSLIQQRIFLTETEALPVFRDLVEGVYHIHRSGVVHRDIKPENLLFDSNGRLLICDFGVSSWNNGPFHGFCGSYWYAAPEAYLNPSYDGEAADVWSCGITLYFMLCGQPPFRYLFDYSASVQDAFELVRSTDLILPTRLSLQVRSLLKRMLEKDPASRATMDEVISHPWVCPTMPPVVRLDIAESASTARASLGPLNIAQKAAAQTGQPTLSPQATITIRNRILGSSAGVQTLNTYEATPRATLRVVNEGLGNSAGVESLNTSQSTPRATIADNNGGFGEVEGVESLNTSQSTLKATVALQVGGLGDVAGVETLKTSQSTQKAASTVDCEGLGDDAGHSIEPTNTSQAILVMNDKDLEKDLVLQTDQSSVIREVPLVVKENFSDAVDVPALKSDTCFNTTVVAIRVDQKDDISAFSVSEDQLPRIQG
ncbi:Protein kinase, partial [Dinochytrium kinnereticum]